MRTLLIYGARAVVQRAERRTDTQGRWLCALNHRKGTNVAAVAFANKNARVIWPCWPMMRDIDHPPRRRQGRHGLREERSSEPPHTWRIHTKECSEDHP
jgi:hypothetical protein